jgi:hypothetical protein
VVGRRPDAEAAHVAEEFGRPAPLAAAIAGRDSSVEAGRVRGRGASGPHPRHDRGGLHTAQDHVRAGSSKARISAVNRACEGTVHSEQSVSAGAVGSGMAVPREEMPDRRDLRTAVQVARASTCRHSPALPQMPMTFPCMEQLKPFLQWGKALIIASDRPSASIWSSNAGAAFQLEPPAALHTPMAAP